MNRVVTTAAFLLLSSKVFGTRYLELMHRFDTISAKNGSRLVRPRSNGATTKVKVSVDLLSLDMNPLTAKVDLRALLKLSWEDGRLAWTNKAYRTDTMWVEPEKLWTPDLAIFNRIAQDPVVPLKSPGWADVAVVRRDGRVELQAEVEGKIRCFGYLERPAKTEKEEGLNGRSIWDEFECELLRLGSWAYGRGDVEYEVGDVTAENLDGGSSIEVVGDVSVRSMKKTKSSGLSFSAVLRSKYFVGSDDYKIYWNPATNGLK